AVVLDAWSRRVVGWAMATHLRTELVLEALNLALTQRRPTEVIHHSDQGCQYTSLAFGRRCDAMGVRPSMGSVGDAYDNAMCESFFATLECELLDRSRFQTQVEARMAVFEYIEGWYNPHRRHSPAGWRRELIVAHASDVLGVEVTRSALRHAPGGVANWKRWRLARAVRRAAPRRRKTRPRGSPRGTPDRKR